MWLAGLFPMRREVILTHIFVLRPSVAQRKGLWFSHDYDARHIFPADDDVRLASSGPRR